MDHLSLNWPWPNDRDLDYQVIELFRLQARQHAHLGPALNLEDADCIGLTDHFVHGFVILRHGRERVALVMVLGHKIEAFVNRREHAEGQAIDLENAEYIE